MKFNEKLVLNSYMLSLFGVSSFEELAKDLKESQLEELDENDTSLFYYELMGKFPNKKMSDDKLLEYDENIVRHIKMMGFNKNQTTSSGGTQSSADYSDIKIIEITKLAEKESADGKTVAVESFETNNLVFIDEGHRGSSGDIWKTNRDKLSVNGFAFEYSATFTQAINSSTGAKKKELENEYAKAILFDYSYKYFYNDGYGKDYSILNLSDDDERTRQTYLIASLLSFYQQMKIYESSKSLLKPYLVEKPLMVFVGSSVNAVRVESKRQVSDVVDALLFINEFIKNRSESIATIQKIMSLDSGLNKQDGSDIFTNKFVFLGSTKLDATAMFNDMLNIIFNASSGVLHIENLKGVDGEIALRIGENDYFGVINVGDSDKLTKLCDTNGMSISSREFSSSLFKSINETTSNLNILIGSKKFSEGWSSWRVSTMGIMNVGKKEGSQIIQLFGRGVRLKGHEFCLKRSRAIRGRKLEKKYQAKAISKKVVLSLYRKVDVLESQKKHTDKLGLSSEILQKEHLSFVNVDNLFFSLQQFKNEKGWSNLSISKSNIENILSKNDWYKLYIPKNDMSVKSFKNLAKFEVIIITLFKKYMKSFYEYKKSEWESQFLEYRELDETRDRANFI